MNYEIISSNSKGNAIILEENILLDCGVAYKRLCEYLKDIKLIFISHIHNDHLKGSTVGRIAYNFPNIKFVCGSKDVLKKLIELGVDKDNIFFLEKDKWYDLGICKVSLVGLFHDVENYGIKIDINDKKCLYMVDTTTVEGIEAIGYDLYLIESNYREDIINRHLEECEDDGERYYLERTLRTHLSYEDSNSFLIDNMRDNSSYQYIHTSSFNFEER